MKQVGATNAMRLEAVAKDGRKVVLKYAHEDLEVCVGIATAAFVVATLRGDVSAVNTVFSTFVMLFGVPALQDGCPGGRQPDFLFPIIGGDAREVLKHRSLCTTMLHMMMLKDREDLYPPLTPRRLLVIFRLSQVMIFSCMGVLL